MEVGSHKCVDYSISIKEKDSYPGLGLDIIQGEIAFLIRACFSAVIDGSRESKGWVYVQAGGKLTDVCPEDCIET